ncbi:hypothetical protein COB11_02915 [Candidatus Aerophobetes bacterium]|uniref:MOMP-like family protein n=1 Tax=Aerophobetes bacterium TaxID=2030807 RepID=A0A2A4YJZ6_UNCAE|nr:MAG: hypothetical protein COB11_02915 [Candidatus Aerophobetes bacterium]
MQKKFLRSLTPALICLASVAFAGQYTKDNDHMYAEHSDLENKVITPNASPIVKHGVDVFFSADFIYWTGRLDGLGYAFTGSPSGTETDNAAFVNQAAGVNVASGRTSYVNRKWSPGFKVGIGLDLGHDGWDLGAEYTWFRTSPSGSITGGTALGTAIIATFQPSPSSQIINSGAAANLVIADASARYRLHFNVMDVSLGRNFFVSPRLTTRPHFGLKGTWQTQRFTPRYNNITGTITSGTTTTTISDAFYHHNFKQSYWGVGIRTGMDTSWQFIQSFGVYGNWALSALWGQFDVNRRDTTQSTETIVDTENSSNDATNVILPSRIVDVTNRFHTLSPVLELALGLRYDYWFSDNDYRFRIQAGWEEQIWFDQNQLFDIQILRPLHGNLIFQGFTLKVRFDF